MGSTAAFIGCGRKPFAAFICTKFARRLRENMLEINLAQDAIPVARHRGWEEPFLAHANNEFLSVSFA